ncbi:hypothetical protein [Desulfitobacterium chlororespirans]|nr:hypothetical protein [Desulfitobacterium chlororespirans]
MVVLCFDNIDDSRVNKRWKQELVQYLDETAIHELIRLEGLVQVSAAQQQPNRILFAQ